MNALVLQGLIDSRKVKVHDGLVYFPRRKIGATDETERADHLERDTLVEIADFDEFERSIEDTAHATMAILANPPAASSSVDGGGGGGGGGGPVLGFTGQNSNVKISACGVLAANLLAYAEVKEPLNKLAIEMAKAIKVVDKVIELVARDVPSPESRLAIAQVAMTATQERCATEVIAFEWIIKFKKNMDGSPLVVAALQKKLEDGYVSLKDLLSDSKVVKAHMPKKERD